CFNQRVLQPVRMVHAHIALEPLDAQEPEIGCGLGIASDTCHLALPYPHVDPAPGTTKSAGSLDPFIHFNGIFRSVSTSSERYIQGSCGKCRRGKLYHFSASHTHGVLQKSDDGSTSA